ncbi:MAG TPA: sterol desaturase family protein [Bacteroidia bacterium]|nr:sterol desaturase family protein [Bacteroidia bacterium]
MSKFFTYAYLLLLLRYLIIAGVFFLIFYVIKPKRFLKLRIQNAFPKRKDYYREIGYSLLSFIFFALFAIVVFRTPLKNHTLIYDHISQYGWGYFILSIILALAIHDAYFYWTHRLMHHPKLFKAFHLVHHKSTNPSPWAAFTFHPLEAMVEAGILPVLVFIIPITKWAVLAFFLISTVINVYGHLGYEIYPAWLIRSKVGKWLNTSVSHNMHHKYFNGNYSFYTRVWDVMMGTMHPDYDKSLDKVLGNNEATELNAPASLA